MTQQTCNHPKIHKLKTNHLKTNTLKMALLTTALSTIFGIQTSQAQTPDQKAEKLICDTIQACQQLSKTIEAQIQELEAKGLENLTPQERLQYAKLQKQIISTENQQQRYQQELIADENQKQEHQQQLIADEKSETESQKEEIMAELKAQNSKLDELRGSLLSK